jgi:hypothetical protein
VAGFYSGRDGALYIGTSTTKAAKVQNWNFSVSQAVLETTAMGDTDRTITDGIRSYSGSARLFYYTTSGGSNVKDIIQNSIKRSSGTAAGDGENAASTNVKLKLQWIDGSTPRQITFWVFVTSLSMGASMGEVSSVDINWEANGAPIEDTLATGAASTGS